MLKVPDRATDGSAGEILLVKKTRTHGSLAVGCLYRWSYKRLSRDEAVVKAFSALVRDHPDEMRIDWEVREDG